MGFILTVIYIVLTIISPEQFGPAWAHYHALEYLAGMVILASLPNLLSGQYLRSSTQMFLLVGLFVAIAFSEVANGWFGGVLVSWQAFLPSAAIFFFVATNVTTIRRLKVVTLAAVASCMIVVVEALCGYYGRFRGDTFVLHDYLFSHDEVVGNLFRLRGVGFLNDPNDFAQILLVALPLLFITWRPRRLVHNSLLVCMPACVLLWAIYLTHSRGALIGSVVLILMAARERLGATASAVLTGALALGMMALDFTGGRAISASEGAERLDAWASGLELFKSAPIFGVGFGSFADLNGITAHNSFVLCLAELGLVGSIIWVALLVTTMMSLNSIVDSYKKGQTMTGGQERTAHASSEGYGEETVLTTTALADNDAFHFDGKTVDFTAICVERQAMGNMAVAATAETTWAADLDPEEEHPSLEGVLPSSVWRKATATADTATDVKIGIDDLYQHTVPKQWVVVMRLALISFMATGWFLSRTYSATMYLVLGLATATVSLEGATTSSSRSSRWCFFTLAIHAAMISFIYLIVRLRY
jgi:putative inorganic carbon (HCO3(-)) transporter